LEHIPYVEKNNNLNDNEKKAISYHKNFSRFTPKAFSEELVIMLKILEIIEEFPSEYNQLALEKLNRSYAPSEALLHIEFIQQHYQEIDLLSFENRTLALSKLSELSYPRDVKKYLDFLQSVSVDLQKIYPEEFDEL
jgi:hypothetical protein